MSLILAIEPDAAQADAVRRAVRTLAGVDLVLVESRDAGLAVLKGRIPDLILLSALLPPGDEAALAAQLRTAATAEHVEMITIPLLEHAPDRGKGLFGGLRRRKGHDVRISQQHYAGELRLHLERIAEAKETSALARRRKADTAADGAVAAASQSDEPEPIAAASDAAAVADEFGPTAHDWAGPRDSLGERETSFDDEGRPTELLRLAPEFAEARASIADRIVRLADANRSSFANALRLESDAQTGRLILVSERIPGARLARLIERAAQQSIVPDLPASLFVMRRLLATAASVSLRTGVSHLAIAPERIVVTARAEIVIVEAAVAAALESRLGFEPDARADIAQVALTGLSLALGRSLPADHSDDDRQQLLAELVDVATIRVSHEFAGALQSWFERSLAHDMSASFADFAAAAAALAETGTSRADGSVALRRVLKAFIDELADPALQDESEIEAARVRAVRARQIASRYERPSIVEAAEPEMEIDVAPSPAAGAFASAESGEIPLVRFDEPAVEDVEEIPAQNVVPAYRPATEFVAEESANEEIAAKEIATDETAIEEPPALAAEAEAAPPQEETRKRTLLELFRSARAGESDPDAAPAFLRRDAPEPVAPASPAEPPSAEIFAQASAESEVVEEPQPAATFEQPAEELPAEEISLDPEPPHVNIFRAPAEETAAFTAEPDVVEPIHAAAPADPSDQPMPAVDSTDAAPPVTPPASERRKPSLLELFRPSRPHDPEAETETSAAPELISAEEPSAEPSQTEIVAQSIEPASAAHTEPSPPIFAEAPPAVPVIAEKPEEAPRAEPAAPRKSLLGLLRSSPFRKAKPEPEPASPPAAPPPVEETPAETTPPLTDVFAELIQAARAVAPASPPPSAAKPARPIKEKTPPPIVEKPAATIKEKAAKPPKKAEPPPVVEPPKPAWTPPAPVEPVAPTVDPAAVSSDWPTWNVEEFRQSQFASQPPETTPSATSWADTLTSDASAADRSETLAANEAIEPVPATDEHDWPTWTTEPAETPEPPAAAPKKRRKHSLRDIFRSRSEVAETVETAEHADVEEHTELAQHGDIAEHAELPEHAEAAVTADVPQTTEFAEFADFAEPAEAAEVPAFADVPPPVPAQPPPAPSFAPPPPTYAPPPTTYTPPAPTYTPRPASTPPSYAPPATYVPPAPPAAPPTYAAAPAPTYTPPPPTYVAPPPPPPSPYIDPASTYSAPAPRTYAPPTPPRGSPGAYDASSPAQPIRLAPVIPVEAPIRLAPAVASRPAEVEADRPFVPATFRGPVARKAPASQPSRKWARFAGGAVAVVCLAIAGRAYYLSAPERTAVVEEDPAKKPIIANPKGMGTLSITSDPPGARVTIDGKPRGVTPLTINNLRAGSHRVVLDGTDGTVKRDIKIVAGRETKLDESIYSGWVAIYAPFELRIFEGTRLLGTTEEQPMLLAPGRHQLELTNTDLGFHETRGVEVIPGETTTINIKTAEGIVHINAPDGAEVWVDGKRMGSTPVGDLRVPIGSREIVLKHPELGEQRAIANVTVGAPVEVTIEFRRPKT